MKRIEKIEEIQNRVLELHKELFGWAQDHRDGSTHYMLDETPAKYDYEKWKAKKTALENAIKFLEEVINAKKELAKINAEDAIRWDGDNYNVSIEVYKGVLYVGYNYKYFEILLDKIPITIETDKPLTEAEFKEAKRTVFYHLPNGKKFELIKTAFENILSEVKEHIKFLEEEVEDC